MKLPYVAKKLLIPVLGLLLMIFSSQVLTYEDYSGCSDCHGGFRDGNYTSLQDGTNWGTDLMSGHEPFVGDECDACHKSGGRGEVFLNLSQDGTLFKSCVGCHGRDEDVTGNCVGGSATQCGSGAGLRKMHATNVPASNCGACHSGDSAPVGEQTLPYNFGLGGVVMQDSCDGDGTESQFGSTGLDNDGDGLRDGGDSDCQSNSPPSQPGTLSASAITTSSATVSWGASTDSDGDTITYTVEYRRNGDVPWTGAGTTTTLSRALSGLDADQFYDVQVTPNDGTVDGSARTTANLFKTDADITNTPPTQPGVLSASAVTTSSATVSWGASTDNEGDTITYTVEFRRTGDAPWSSAGTTTTLSRPLSGLDSSQAYDVQVTPNDGTVDGTSRMELSLFTTVTVNTPPTQPGTLSASAVTINSATVSWGASTDNEGDTITYTVEYRRNGDPSWTSAGSTTLTSRPLSGLDSSQAYDVRVTPNDGSVDGPVRMALNLFTTDTPNTPPTQPGALSASAITTDSATVSWVASTDVDGDTIIYQVEYRRNGDVSWTSAGSTTNTSQPLSGLDASQSYDVQVTPNDGTEDGPVRSMMNLFVTDDPNIPPTQPGALSASAIGISSATVSWGASTDDDGDTITYKVEFRRNGAATWTSAGTTTETSKSLSGLVSDQAYDVRVTPNDGTENGLDRTALSLFQTDVNPDVIFKDSFEGG